MAAAAAMTCYATIPTTDYHLTVVFGVGVPTIYLHTPHPTTYDQRNGPQLIIIEREAEEIQMPSLHPHHRPTHLGDIPTWIPVMDRTRSGSNPHTCHHHPFLPLPTILEDWTNGNLPRPDSLGAPHIRLPTTLPPHSVFLPFLPMPTIVNLLMIEESVSISPSHLPATCHSPEEENYLIPYQSPPTITPTTPFQTTIGISQTEPE